MSKGPGAIESRIAELFAATRDRGLSVAEIADHAFALKGRPATRAQRLSATRAAHRAHPPDEGGRRTGLEIYARPATKRRPPSAERPPLPKLPKRAPAEAA